MPNQQKRVLPPVYFLVAIVAMVALHLVMPVYHWLSWPWKAIGALPIVLGLLILLIADNQFKRHETTVKPFQSSATLVSDGVFRLSRNPMYLGMVLVLIGIGIGLASVTSLLVIPVFVWLLTVKFIVVEEQSLQRQFDQVYADYKARVRRWF